MGRKRKLEMSSYLNESSNSSSQTHLNVVQRSAANDRERTRMRVLSKAFVRLKTSLPWVPSDTKLSKLDTLKLATSYISYLTKILEDDDLAAATNQVNNANLVISAEGGKNLDEPSNNNNANNQSREGVYTKITSSQNAFVSLFLKENLTKFFL